MQIEYVTCRVDELPLKALSALNRLAPGRQLQGDESLVPLMEAKECRDTLFVALYSSPGRYPSRHYRIVQERDLTNRELTLPAWAPAWGYYGPKRLIYVALRKKPDVDNVHCNYGFRQSMCDLHRRISGKLGYQRVSV